MQATSAMSAAFTHDILRQQGVHLTEMARIFNRHQELTETWVTILNEKMTLLDRRMGRLEGALISLEHVVGGLMAMPSGVGGDGPDVNTNTHT